MDAQRRAFCPEQNIARVEKWAVLALAEKSAATAAFAAKRQSYTAEAVRTAGARRGTARIITRQL